MIAVYMRISSDSQKHASQEDAIKQWLAQQNYNTNSIKWYADVESSKTLARPQFRNLQKDIDDKKINTVVVYKLDRLSRRLMHGIQLLSNWLEKDVRIVITTMNIDLKGVVGQMVATLMFALAEIENEHRRERQAAGIAIAKKLGVYQGGKPGRTKVPNGVKEVAALTTRQLKTSEIAKLLKISTKTVGRYQQQARKQGILHDH